MFSGWVIVLCDDYKAKEYFQMLATLCPLNKSCVFNIRVIGALGSSSKAIGANKQM